MISQRRFLFQGAILALLAGCTTSGWPPVLSRTSPPPPAPVDIHRAETEAYLSGVAAGRRAQKREDEAAMAAPVPPISARAQNPVPAPVRPTPIPPDAYAAKGPAKAVPIP